MDLNLYLGLPPLPPPPGRLDVAADYPSLLLNSAATVANEQRGSVVVAAPPPAAAAYSPSNALSAPEQVLVDPVAAWLVDPVSSSRCRRSRRHRTWPGPRRRCHRFLLVQRWKCLCRPVEQSHLLVL